MQLPSSSPVASSRFAVKEQIDRELGLDPDMAILCSAKEGIGIDAVLEAVVAQVPPAKGDLEAPLSALIFDANYDSYRGTVVSCRVFTGQVRPGDLIRTMYNNTHPGRSGRVFRR